MLNVLKAIDKYNKFLITAHINPEGDSLGSQLSLGALLGRLGKGFSIVDEDKVPSTYKFLPQVKAIRAPDSKVEFEAAFILDCSSIDRIGKVRHLISKDKPIINIDHHPGNSRFGTVNWIDTTASSCCEMIYRLYEEWGLSLNRQIATWLYVGLLTDTGSFRYPNTNPTSHRLAAKFLEWNLNVNRIYSHIYESNSFSDMKLLALVLPTLKRDSSGKIAWLKLSRHMLKGKKDLTDQTENILDFARGIKGVELAILFKETLSMGEVRINLRSQGGVDVGKLAQFFAGGGHKTASGATLKGTIDEVERIVLRKAREMLK